MALARVGSGRVRGSRNYRKFVRFAAVLALGVRPGPLLDLCARLLH
jgi:hypothetical protein